MPDDFPGEARPPKRKPSRTVNRIAWALFLFALLFTAFVTLYDIGDATNYDETSYLPQ